MIWFNVLTANIRKGFIELKRYLPNTISMIVTFYILFLFTFLGIKIIGNPESQAVNIQYSIVSMMLWFLALMAMQGIGWEITTEATRGTLEQLYMSPVATWKILLARMIGNIGINIILMTVILIMSMLTTGQWLVFDIVTLIPLFVILIIGMLGVGFMIAGLAILFKQISSFLQVIQFVFLALVMVPISLSPYLELLPIVRASSMIREAMIESSTIFNFSLSSWLLLIINAVVYFIVGIVLYKISERRAMNRGLLGQY